MLCKFKEYQDNTNSGLKKFTWFLSWVHASATGGETKFFLEHLPHTCKLSKSSCSVSKKKRYICTLHKLTIEIGYIMPTWYMKHDLYYRKVI